MIKVDKLIRSKRRSISIQISSVGEVVLHVPNKCSFEKIKEVLEEKRGWIETHRQRILKSQQLNSDIISYKKVLFLGYTKDIVFADQLKKVQMTANCIFVPQKIKDNLQKIKKNISSLLIENAMNILRKRVEYFANLMQLKPSLISLINSKRLWGSCSQNDEIKLNWRLVMVLPDLIDYVVVHELAHIIEFNHSQKFWKIVESFIPNYRERRSFLKKGDFLLSLFR